MKPWERRLRDLSVILEACHRFYFDPEGFRRSLNQFLQTSRTVTFIIQKEKAQIPNFQSWYDEATSFWKDDKILLWAKESRNTVEKIGDLELYSSIKVSLVRSYIEGQDAIIEIQEERYLAAAIAKIFEHLKRELGHIANDEWAIKIERRWIANTLPEEELLWVLNVIYYHQYQICKQACIQVGSTMSSEIPEPADMDTGMRDSRHIRYLDSTGYEFKSLKNYPIPKDFNVKLDYDFLDKYREEFQKIDSFESGIEILANQAAALFLHNGAYAPTLFSFNSKMELVDYIMTEFKNPAWKFVFWREIADRVSSQSPYCVYFISEGWLKKVPEDRSKYYPVSSLPIKGEMLQIFGITNTGDCLDKCFHIHRNLMGQPTLGAGFNSHKKDEGIPFFLRTVADAISVNRRKKN